jgi:hypothetical protein
MGDQKFDLLHTSHVALLLPLILPHKKGDISLYNEIISKLMLPPNTDAAAATFT